MVNLLATKIFLVLAIARLTQSFSLMSKIIGINPSENLLGIKEFAIDADRKSGDKFWSEVIEFSPEHCTLEFARQLEAKFKSIDDDKNEGIKSLKRQIHSQTMTKCSEIFADQVYDFYGSIESADGLGELAEQYEFMQENSDDNTDEFAIRIAHEVRKVSSDEKIKETARFKTVYTDESPCPKVYRALEQPQLQSYEKFLRLTMLPEYRSEVYWTHLIVSDILATCDYIKSNEKLLELAFDKYKSEADLDDNWNDE